VRAYSPTSNCEGEACEEREDAVSRVARVGLGYAALIREKEIMIRFPRRPLVGNSVNRDNGGSALTPSLNNIRKYPGLELCQGVKVSCQFSWLGKER
jgi:hypothetical protein